MNSLNSNGLCFERAASNMLFAACFYGLVGLPLVRADGWDDLSNNLATDLAPFLSLFGEQITKQYLSESITALDYFIFALAPMGILTAVVSAIRVCDIVGTVEVPLKSWKNTDPVGIGVFHIVEA